MPLAFVMINVKVGTDLQVVSELKTMKNVLGVYEVYSVYDIVAEVKVDTMEELEVINSKIRHLTNIISTHTMVVAEKMSAGIFNS
jgi:DNA-binding Lrp family transcriptional regulator